VNDLDSNQAERHGAAQVRADEFNRSLLRAIQEASPEGILVVDERAVVVSYNQRFLEIWHVPSERMQPDDDRHGIIPDNPILLTVTQRVKDPEGFLRRVQALYANHHARDYCEIELKDGRIVERQSVGLHNDDGVYLGRVWFFRDITERKRAEAALRDLAWRDPLTGIMNRGHFFERAAEELQRARRYHHPLAMLMLDLDHFKGINDQYGHAAGDKVLETVCERWCRLLRSVDMFGRIGGEEFAILMPDTELEAAGVVAERLRAAVADRTIAADGREIRCSVSAGVSPVHVDDASIEDVLRRADDALYRAKDAGRNRIEGEP
jgi:diguanylate cyclase (GGDEF)-like protein